ncbi:myeloid-derived growth factor isoform X1 [Vulpes vulpes]|uniref:Myeloid-derived growth factor isoform X1 n=1 Tax=Vulpes vulpes TaxID=9627 RepID=A0ABM4XIF5_VULVU
MLLKEGPTSSDHDPEGCGIQLHTWRGVCLRCSLPLPAHEHMRAFSQKWQMSLGTSEDHQHFTCTIWRPQGKSYLYFTQFKAEVRGAEIEYGMAYSKAAFERESDVPLKSEEFEVTKTAVSHRPGAFKAELSKLVIVAKASRSEL